MASYAMIKELKEKTDKNGNGYLDLIVIGSDKKEYPAKVWRFENNGMFSVNDVIEIEYKADDYKGRTQLNITSIKKADDSMISEFVPSSQYDGKLVYSMLMGKVNDFKDEELRSIVSYIMQDKKEELEVYPAAFRLHHAMVGGLMLHTASIVAMAEKICEVYPAVNRELLISGAILHDVAKVYEMSVSKSGLCDSYTLGGELIGHLVKGAMYIEQAAQKLGITGEKVLLLEHMVLSHHGNPEYGAAKFPMFLEAEILARLDDLDATVFEITTAVSQVDPGKFTDKMWMLDNRKLYNHPYGETQHRVNLK